MNRIPLIVSLIVSLCLSIACRDQSQTKIHDTAAREDFKWNLPAQIPLPIIDPENPMSEAKFQLGRHLFYDERLSGNGSMSCSSCHQQEKAFTDGRVLAIGSTGQTHPRNSQGLSNVAYNATLTWANTVLVTVEKQVFVPLFGQSPIEHGLTRENWPDVVLKLKLDARYTDLFKTAYPEDSEHFTQAQITKALAVFVRGLTSFDSPYDRHLAGDNKEYNASASAGEKLFFSEKMECFHCHGGYNFSDSTADRTTSFINRPFHNTGLYNIDGSGNYPEGNRGIFELTARQSDMGRFRAPSLRNIAKTAPYMHDGSVAELSDVLDFYSAGGRNIANGPHQGDGRKNPFKDGFVTGFTLSEQEKRDVISFLESLTDETFITNPRFANPW
ncbi:MAG: di-heme enzyme [Proteobacteria bacterium]|nr:MAG: di-heme enzyme [Pseudomonadota bacterium]